MQDPTPETFRKLEQIRANGFKFTDTTGSYRLIRPDGSQAALYSLGGNSAQSAAENVMGLGTNSGNLGNISNKDTTFDAALTNAVTLMNMILTDEAQRRQLPQWSPPSLESSPYG